jgi:hypothetical protein
MGGMNQGRATAAIAIAIAVALCFLVVIPEGDLLGFKEQVQRG